MCIGVSRCIAVSDTYVYDVSTGCIDIALCDHVGGKCIHLYSDTLVRYIGIHHTYTSMKPNETAIHQMYRTSIQLYIFPHMVTEPQYRDTVIQRDTARYSDTAIQRDTPIHMYHHPSGYDTIRVMLIWV